jgi:hypothetical protein
MIRVWIEGKGWKEIDLSKVNLKEEIRIDNNAVIDNIVSINSEARIGY